TVATIASSARRLLTSEPRLRMIEREAPDDYDPQTHAALLHTRGRCVPLEMMLRQAFSIDELRLARGGCYGAITLRKRPRRRPTSTHPCAARRAAAARSSRPARRRRPPCSPRSRTGCPCPVRADA